MKELVINNSLNIVKKSYPDYTEEKLEIIKYGLTGLYLTVSKTIIIFSIAFLLGVLKELIIFTLIYNIIRMPSFGIHASSSIKCLISSSLIFIGLTYINNLLIINDMLKIILGISATILIFKNSPADTSKKPIINRKRRLIYKLVSTVISIIFVVISLKINNNFICNSLIMSLLLQCIMISPITYKIFGQPYNNYKNYL